ncbi:hypothetical protein ACQR10_29615 [Bradyrhizobium sp. HKCCYLRH2060]|uniref:hypothetical protein n=1 Tax=Bradyrhizobium sp. HKCCYLRH2060 TaxID=3420743 RepID=UPI003EB9FC2A
MLDRIDGVIGRSSQLASSALETEGIGAHSLLFERLIWINLQELLRPVLQIDNPGDLLEE